MNVRDPFNLRRPPALTILRGTATLAAASLTQRVLETGAAPIGSSKQAAENMSTFSMPKNVPSFSNPQRELEDRVWGSSGVTARSANPHHGRGIGGVQDRLGGFFEKNRDLPMYKDKPYSYASSRRRRSLWKSKRVFALIGLFIMSILYYLGFWGGEDTAEKVKDGWGWLQKPEKAGGRIDWLSRRERVVEAFTLSWDAYVRYAWGRSILCTRQRVKRFCSICCPQSISVI
jgi:endoplasmic reticulum Man9GlcNAc2 1,2-alpha-mannosidase